MMMMMMVIMILLMMIIIYQYIDFIINNNYGQDSTFSLRGEHVNKRIVYQYANLLQKNPI